ncbi:Glucan endo-1,3-beta-glucosidase 1 [Acorus calamus]|uniref:Glucan endo-1,3-beta-glucosidase 1 n=1 Tax=Acorus calamus TaxID=4465 RepID=A0AAV9DVB3_ACOCL|nr:Glucan endo-1,3-beta-glucosidase 1 [Acorus calamus]
MQNRGVVPLENSLFKPLPPSKEEVDPNTLLHYTNVFDAMIDAVYFSMSNLNFTDVEVLVTETGWPSKGDPKVEPFANADNADAYNSNLIKHVLVDRGGTPLRPATTPSVYIYELFDEDLRPGPVSEANWGLFYGNGTPTYLLHVRGRVGSWRMIPRIGRFVLWRRGRMQSRCRRRWIGRADRAGRIVRRYSLGWIVMTRIR